jgi:hypothetical protein
VSKSEELPDVGWFRIPVESDPPDLAFLVVGIDPAGPCAWREVGVDPAGDVVHRCPDERFEMGTYGWFDPHTPPVSEGVPISREEFEAAWAQEPVLPSPPEPLLRGWWHRQVGSTRSRPQR